MTVYVLTDPQLGWDCVLGVCKNMTSVRSRLEEYAEGLFDDDDDSKIVIPKRGGLARLKEAARKMDIFIHSEELS